MRYLLRHLLARVASLPSKVTTGLSYQAKISSMLNLSTMLCNISIAAQNCNSLNISTTCPKQLKKLYSITELGTDLIFLSDLRLSNNTNNIRDLENSFLACNRKQYIFFYNSTRNSRGTGILIAQGCGMTVIEEFRDINENILGLHVKLRESEILLISVYGPNNNLANSEDNFFECLHELISTHPDLPVICGGDWNCTISCNKAENNIDVFSMTNIPSVSRSTRLNELCINCCLSDPFRAMHPHTRDFTYIPRHGGKNRSRIDFFLVSDALVSTVSRCNINPALSTELFDHKAIIMKFHGLIKNNRVEIKHETLSHPRINYVIKSAVLDTYISHASLTLANGNIDEYRHLLGNVYTTMRNINDLELIIESGSVGNGENLANLLGQRVEELELLDSNMPTPETLATINLSCDDDIFLEVLMGNVKNSIISFQAFQNKVKTVKKTNLFGK